MNYEKPRNMEGTDLKAELNSVNCAENSTLKARDGIGGVGPED